MVCRFENGKVSPPVTSDAGTRWPRRGGVARHFKTDPTETVSLCFGYPKTNLIQ
jgi:hypothetical protein